MTTADPIDVEENESVVLIDLENVRLSWEKCYRRVFRYTDLCWLCELLERRFQTDVGRVVVFMSDPKECEGTTGREQLHEMRLLYRYLQEDQARSTGVSVKANTVTNATTLAQTTANVKKLQKPFLPGCEKLSANALVCASVTSECPRTENVKDDLLVVDLTSDDESVNDTAVAGETASSTREAGEASSSSLDSSEHSSDAGGTTVVETLGGALKNKYVAPGRSFADFSERLVTAPSKMSNALRTTGNSVDLASPDHDTDDDVEWIAASECLPVEHVRGCELRFDTATVKLSSMRTYGAPQPSAATTFVHNESLAACGLADDVTVLASESEAREFPSDNNLSDAEVTDPASECFSEEEPFVRLGVSACPNCEIVVNAYGYKMSGGRRVQRCCDVAIGTELTTLCFMTRYSRIFLFSADSDFQETARSCTKPQKFDGVIKYAKSIYILGFSFAFESRMAQRAREAFRKRRALRAEAYSKARGSPKSLTETGTAVANDSHKDDEENVGVSIYFIDYEFPVIRRVLNQSDRPFLLPNTAHQRAIGDVAASERAPQKRSFRDMRSPLSGSRVSSLGPRRGKRSRLQTDGDQRDTRNILPAYEEVSQGVVSVHRPSDDNHNIGSTITTEDTSQDEQSGARLWGSEAALDGLGQPATETNVPVSTADLRTSEPDGRLTSHATLQCTHVAAAKSERLPAVLAQSGYTATYLSQNCSSNPAALNAPTSTGLPSLVSSHPAVPYSESFHQMPSTAQALSAPADRQLNPVQRSVESCYSAEVLGPSTSSGSAFVNSTQNTFDAPNMPFLSPAFSSVKASTLEALSSNQQHHVNYRGLPLPQEHQQPLSRVQPRCTSTAPVPSFINPSPNGVSPVPTMFPRLYHHSSCVDRFNDGSTCHPGAPKPRTFSCSSDPNFTSSFQHPTPSFQGFCTPANEAAQAFVRGWPAGSTCGASGDPPWRHFTPQPSPRSENGAAGIRSLAQSQSTMDSSIATAVPSLVASHHNQLPRSSPASELPFTSSLPVSQSCMPYWNNPLLPPAEHYSSMRTSSVHTPSVPRPTEARFVPPQPGQTNTFAPPSATCSASASDVSCLSEISSEDEDNGGEEVDWMPPNVTAGAAENVILPLSSPPFLQHTSSLGQKSRTDAPFVFDPQERFISFSKPTGTKRPSGHRPPLRHSVTTESRKQKKRWKMTPSFLKCVDTLRNTKLEHPWRSQKNFLRSSVPKPVQLKYFKHLKWKAGEVYDATGSLAVQRKTAIDQHITPVPSLTKIPSPQMPGASGSTSARQMPCQADYGAHVAGSSHSPPLEGNTSQCNVVIPDRCHLLCLE